MTSDIARDFHYHDPELLADPWPVYRELREQCPVAHSERYGGFWILSRYEDILAATRDTDTFSSAHGVTIPEMSLDMPLLPFETDPPRHTAYRQLLLKRFSRSAIEELRPYAVTVADGLLDDVADASRCDLVEDYALPLTSEVFGQLLTLPADDRSMVTRWTNQIMERVAEPDVAATAMHDMVEYLDALIQRRREDPGDDVLGVMLEAEIDGRSLTHEEVLSLCFTFVLAGLETTIVAIGASLLRLGEDLELRSDLIARPELLGPAVEELLRYEPPAQGHARTLTRDVELHGQRLSQGDRVLLLWGAANRDPDRFEAPDEFIADRQPNRHFTFGAGPHRCVGAPLARMEVEVAVERILRRFPRYRILDDEDIVTFKPTRGPRTLPVRLGG